MPDHAGVSVIIVNFRTRELTAEAVRSVLDDPALHGVVVVDNGSGDGSAAFLREAFPLPQVQVVESPENLGFGRGVNLGATVAEAPFFFLLNSDAVVRPGTLGLLRRVLVDDPGAGVVAPAVYLADGRTLQDDAFGPMPATNALLRTDRSRRNGNDPGWVSGVAMMLRRDDFLALGGFDPDFVMYLEDVDLCRRIVASGKRVVREPSATVVHLGGRSGMVPGARVDQFHRSKLVYLRKAGAGPLQLRCAAVLRMARLVVLRVQTRVRHP